MTGIGKGARLWLVVTALMLNTASSAFAGLVNGDFETGDFTGWTIYKDSNGELFGNQPPRIDLFDTSGTGFPSSSAHFNVGRNGFPIVDDAGGGIFQNVDLPSGDVILSVDAAVYSVSSNIQGGIFKLLFNGVVVDRYDVADVGFDSFNRHTLSATIENVPAGTHEIRIHIGRNPGALGPDQYLDNVSIISVPEPASLAPLGIGLMVVAIGWRRSLRESKRRPAIADSAEGRLG